MLARAEHLRDRTSRQACADGNTIAERLRQGHDIGLDGIVLVREPAPCTAHAGLDLIQHQQPTVAITDLPQACQIIGRWRIDATLALDRLDQDSNDILIARQSIDRSQIIVWNLQETWHQGLEALPDLLVAGGG